MQTPIIEHLGQNSIVLYFQAIRTLRGANFMKRQALEMEARGLQLLEEAVSCTPAEKIGPAIKALLTSGVASVGPAPAVPVRLSTSTVPSAAPVSTAPASPPRPPHIPGMVKIPAAAAGAADQTATDEQVIAGPSSRVTRAEAQMAEQDDPPSVEGGFSDPKFNKEKLPPPIPVQAIPEPSGRKWTAKDLPTPNPDVLYSFEMIEKVDKKTGKKRVVKKITYSCPLGCTQPQRTGDLPIGASKEGVRAHMRICHTGQAFMCDQGERCRNFDKMAGHAYDTTNAELFARHATACGSTDCLKMQYTLGVVVDDGSTQDQA